MRILADTVIDVINETTPGRRPDTRPIHAPGASVTGWFQGSSVAPAHTSAEHFGGARIPVTVRFSDGTGHAHVPDSVKMVRGMAVRFHLGDVERSEDGVLTSPRACDLVSVTMPAFFVSSVDRFLQLTRAAVPRPPRPLTRWQRVKRPVGAILQTLRLEDDLDPAERGLFDFANEHPPARLAMAAIKLLDPPESYATCAYRALHAFRLTAGNRSSFARFTWEPVAGVRPAEPGAIAAGRYLGDELGRRLASGPVEFVLRIQVAEQGDDTTDASKPWSQARPRIVMGHLRLESMPADQDLGSERLAFDPTRLVPGIDVSDDPILLARSEVYRRSEERRMQARL